MSANLPLNTLEYAFTSWKKTAVKFQQTHQIFEIILYYFRNDFLERSKYF